MGNIKDITGLVSGRLTALRLAGVVRQQAQWLCNCSCGKTCVVPMRSLVSGRGKSCGCLRRELQIARNHKHGMTNTPEHGIWKNMKTRCFNKHSAAYKNYGGRGITICERWMTFANFIADMGLRPSPQHMIERKDNDGNYEPSNCVWAVRQEQNSNRRNNVNIEYQGETLTAEEWSRRTGYEPTMIIWRWRRGWSAKDTLTVPPFTGNRKIRNVSNVPIPVRN